MSSEMATTTIGQKEKVIIENDKLAIKEFETIDKDVVSYFKDVPLEKRAERFETALKVGVMAVKTAGLTEKIDYVQKEFQNLNYDFTHTLDSTMKEMEKKYEEVFGEKGKFSEIIQQNFGENGKIIKELFDPNKEGTPLYNLGNTLRNEISQLRQQIGIKEKEDELVQKTPLKGTPFEELCENLIGEVARHYGDSLENTSKKIGRLTDSKKGDFVLTLAGNNKKIVFDMKAQSSPISVNEIQETLKKSIENRDASYGILVVKTVESLPKAVGWFQEYENNKLVCALSTKEREDALHYELLLIACKWARTRVMLQTLQEAKVNAELIRNKIERIQRKLSELSLMKAECTNIETASDKIRTIAKSLQETIGTELSEILGTITTK